MYFYLKTKDNTANQGLGGCMYYVYKYICSDLRVSRLSTKQNNIRLECNFHFAIVG